MKVLIVKLNATGDVVRTTPLLRKLRGEVTWITAARNLVLVTGLVEGLRSLSWEQRELARDTEYDLVISLEDEVEVAQFVSSVRSREIFGAHLGSDGQVVYTDSSREWFDMSLISRFGRKRADELKLINRKSYQEMIFAGLGWRFEGERYLVPAGVHSDLKGDVAMAPVAGPVWPMKTWAYYDELKRQLEAQGLRVNVLPTRESLLQHIADIGNHRCVLGGDSLPMHLALGVGTHCVTLFNCTSPWEIHDYGILTKIVSPLLGEYFYKRDNDPRATRAISIDDVRTAVLHHLRLAA
jgi:lipopolysaccharide heptosyltransferase II